MIMVISSTTLSERLHYSEHFQVVIGETIPEESVARVPTFAWDNPVTVIGAPRTRDG